MELTLTHQAGTQVAVACDGQPSHSFDYLTLIPDKAIPGRPPYPFDDPVAYGEAVHRALFPPGTPARQALVQGPGRILLVPLDEDLHAIPWEYAHGPSGFLVLDHLLVRGLPPDQRRPPPSLAGQSLHIAAVPSDPLDRSVRPLNIDGEWLRLSEEIQAIDHAVTLERARPPTLEQLRSLVAGRHNRVIHFMGHGGHDDKKGAVLLFEDVFDKQIVIHLINEKRASRVRVKN
jgi:hypothetical protein